MILSANLPFSNDQILDYVVNFLQAAHEAHEGYTVRDGINIARYALKRLRIAHSGRSKDIAQARIISALKEAASMILDDSAAEYFAKILELHGDKGTI